MATPAKSDPIADFAWAVKTGDLDSVKDFVEKKKLDVNLVSSNRSPLHWAADFNQVDVITYLLSKGAQIEKKDGYGITPLLAAVYEGHADAVKLLIEKGADQKVKGPDGKTPKEAADKEAVKKLFK